MNVEFEKPLTPERARELLAKAPGVKVVDDPKNAAYPMPIRNSFAVKRNAAASSSVNNGEVDPEVTGSPGK